MGMNEALALVGRYDEPKKLNQALRLAMECAFLISPASSVPMLPYGSVATITAVVIDPKAECYNVGGKRAIGRTGLLRLANAAGVAWNAAASCRLDNRKDPRVVEWHAEGARPDFDGGFLPLVGDLQMDLRENSDQVQRIVATCKDSFNDDGTLWKSAAEAASGQIREMRAKILEHAQSKAKLRAIREALAIRSYETQELLDRPFLIARLMFVGDPKNADDRAAVRDRMLGGAMALFGRNAASPRQLASVAREPEVVVEPDAEEMTGSVVEVCDYCGDTDTVDTIEAAGGLLINVCRGEKCRPMARADEARAAGHAPAPAGAKPSSSGSRGGAVPTMKFGRQKGQPLSAATDENLRWYGDFTERSLKDPSKARYKADNESMLVAIGEEWARRRSSSAGHSPAPLDPDPNGDDDIPF